MKTQINDMLERFSDYVTSHDYLNRPILTAYVNIDTTNPDNQREQPAWLIDLKNERKRLEEEIGADQFKRRADQVRWDNTEELVLSYLQDRKPTGRSVALFTDLEDGFVALDLPIAMETRLYYGLPQIKHLLFALDQYKKYLVALVAGSEVRVAEVFLTRNTGDVHIETEHERLRRLSRKSIDDQGQDRRAPEFERRFVRDVAASIDDFILHDPDSERLVLGGNARLASSIYSALHPSVKDAVVAVAPIDIKIAPAELAERVKALSVVFEQEHDALEVADLVSLHKRGGAAAVGKQEVEQAIAESRVKSLLLPYPMDASEFDELIVSATLLGTPIEFVFGDAADELNQSGGIGAYLYYVI